MFEFHRTVAIAIALLGLFMPNGSAQTFSDPTRPPAAIQPAAQAKAKSKAERPLELQAILHAAGRRVAIINGKRVHEYDSIENAQVLEITKGRVQLIRDGKTFELSLSHDRIKKTESSKARTPVRDDATKGRSQ